MNKRDAFIQVIETVLSKPEVIDSFSQEIWTNAIDFWKEFLNNKPKESGINVTENGVKILAWMCANKENLSNVFTSREIAEGLFTSGRSVSGAMRKLASDGYVQKVGQNPAQYSLTEQGMQFADINTEVDKI